MNLRIHLLLFFTGFTFLSAFAQKEKSKTIVDDSTKVIYGTTTTLIYTSETVYKENRIFFTKDTLFTPAVEKIAPVFNLQFQRPMLFTKEELAQRKKADSVSSAQKAVYEKANLTQNDTTTYYEKDTISGPVNKFRNFFKAKPKKPLPYESRFFKNEYYYFKSDTSIDRIQQYNMNYINDNIYQNLGVIATPSKPVFLTQSNTLGYQSGFNVYNAYYTDPSKVKYYNSKSPFTNIYYVGNPGTTNEDRIKIDINRNVSRNWNIGFSYERIYTDKLIGQSGSTNRSLALGQEFIFYTSTKSKDGRYHFMANASYFLFFNNEQGGLAKINSTNTGSESNVLSDTELPKDISGWPTNLNATSFGVTAAVTQNKIFSRDRRVAYYIYHQYDIFRSGRLSIFHEFDRRNQRYTFGDPFTSLGSSTGSNFYQGSYRMSETGQFNQEFAFLSNKIGAKSSWGNFVAAGYYKYRYVTSSKHMSVVKAANIITSPFNEIGKWLSDPKADIRLHEHYLGGFLKYKIADSIGIEINGEFMGAFNNASNRSDILDSLGIYSVTTAGVNTTVPSISLDTIRVNRSNPYGGYKYNADYNLSFKANIYNFEIGANFTRSSPSLINYYSLQHSYYHWYQSLRPSISNNIYAKYHISKKRYYFGIQPSIFQLQNYVYFNEYIQPVQTAQGTPLFYGFLDLTFNFNIGILHIDTKAKYTYIPQNQPQVIRMPAFYANPRIYLKYVPKSKKNKQDFRFGFDIYYRSTYYGDVYMPSIGQFYVQNSANDNVSNFKLNENVLVDFFITAKLRNARVFLKINQLNQMAGLTKGYYITPYYPAIGGSFQFGVHWLLFD